MNAEHCFLEACRGINVIIEQPSNIYGSIVALIRFQYRLQYVAATMQEAFLGISLYLYVMEKIISENQMSKNQYKSWNHMLRIGHTIAHARLTGKKCDISQKDYDRMINFKVEPRIVRKEYALDTFKQRCAQYGLSYYFTACTQRLFSFSPSHSIDQAIVEASQLDHTPSFADHEVFSRHRNDILKQEFVKQPFHTYRQYLRHYMATVSGTNLCQKFDCPDNQIALPYNVPHQSKSDVVRIDWITPKLFTKFPYSDLKNYLYTISSLECMFERDTAAYGLTKDFQMAVRVAAQMYKFPVIMAVPAEGLKRLSNANVNKITAKTIVKNDNVDYIYSSTPQRKFQEILLMSKGAKDTVYGSNLDKQICKYIPNFADAFVE